MPCDNPDQIRHPGGFLARSWLHALFALIAAATQQTEASAQQFRGVASFAAMHPQFPCDQWLRIYDEALKRKPDLLPAMAILWGTFGDDRTCAQRFADKFADRPHVIEVYFSNGPCRRSERCFDGEFFPEWSEDEYNRRLEGRDEKGRYVGPDVVALGGIHWRMREIERFAARVENPKTRWLVSWELESNLSVAAGIMWEAHYRTLVELGELRRFALVANPHSPRHYGRAEFREFHSKHGRPSGVPNCVANEDGNYDQSEEESRAFLRRYRSCAVGMLWRRKHQGLDEKGSGFTPPKSRRFVISDRDIKVLGKLLAED